MTDAFQYSGSWWHSPSILEPMPGPWAGYEIHTMDVVNAWRRILDWHKEHGLDTVITQISSHFKDRTVLGWGFQYVLNFDRHPEARTFGAKFVARNRRRMSQILEYADKLGIRLFLHHYNFMAPAKFVHAHPSLLSKWSSMQQMNDAPYMVKTRLVCDRIGTLYGNLCWREPVYQAFMKDVWDELLQTFPTLTGILTTPGENQYCLCPDCTRGAHSFDPDELMRARNAIAHEFLSDFCRTFSESMARHRKVGVFRLWGVKGSIDEEFDTSAYPKDLPYMIKYHWFDIIDTGPDPLIADWKRRGYRIWVSHDLWGENAGPVLWNRHDYICRFVETCRTLGVEGIVSHQNNDWETAGIPSFVQGLNLVSYCRAIRSSTDTDDQWLADEYIEKFGTVGAKVYEAMRSYSDFVFHISKIVKIGGEGYTFGIPHPLYPGVGRIGNRVDEWVRGELGELADYIDYAYEHGWDGDLFATRNVGECDLLTRLARMRRNAEAGLSMLESMQDQIPSSARGEFDWLTVSARLCLHQATEYWHMSRVAVLRAAWIGERRPEVRKELATQAIAEMNLAIAAVERIREDLLELPTPTMDFVRTLRSPMSEYLDCGRTFYLHNRETELVQLTREMIGPNT